MIKEQVADNLRGQIAELELGFTEGSYDICAIKEGHTHLLPTGIAKILNLFKDSVDKLTVNEDIICSIIKDKKYTRPCDEISCSKCESLVELIVQHIKKELLDLMGE